MAVKEYFMAWCLLLLTISGLSSREAADMWTLLEQVIMYQGLRKNETRDDESLHSIHVSLWAFYMLSLLSSLIFALSQYLWTATSNIRRKSLADKEMPVSAEEKERSKGIDKGLSSRKEEQRQTSLHDEPMYDSTVGFSQERMKHSNEAQAHENTLQINKKRRNRRKKCAEPDFTDDADVWQIVKKKDKKKTNTPEEVQEKDVKGKVEKREIIEKYTKAEPFTKSSKLTKRRGNNGRLMAAAAARDHSRERLRQQWLEETVQVQVEVPPGRRRHVIGKQGEAMRKLREKYPAVGVSVPRKEDLVTAHLSLDGPKSQVAAAQRDILGHLHDIDKEMQRRKANMTTISLEVDPRMRRYVVGPRGKRLGRLAEEHPSVRVSVPPSDDTNSRSVTLRGPKEEVALVKDTIMAHLKATESQICEAARQRQATNIVVVSMEVEPENRRFIVGRGGERLVRLGQHHPRVRVTVPPADDTNTRSVTLRGPAEEVAAVQASLKDTLLTAQRQLEAEAKRKTKLREAQRLPQAQTS